MSNEPSITSVSSMSITSSLTEAESIINSARNKAEEIKLVAYQEGFQEGRKAAAVATIKLFKDSDEISRNLEKGAGQLAFEVLKKIFNSEFPDLLDPLTEIAKRIMEDGVGAKSIVFLVNESNLSRMVSLEEYLKTNSRIKYQIKGVETLASDSIIVKSEFGEIEVSLKSLLEEISTELRLK